MKEIVATFSIELAYYPGDTDYQKFLAFLEDLGNYADYNWDIPKMQYDLVKSDKEWSAFLSHPERQPYQIKVTEWQDLTLDELYQNVLEVASLTVKYLKKTKDQVQQKTLKTALAPIIRGILHSRYEIESMKITDQYRGISAQMRSSGDLKVTEVHKANFLFATEVVALQLDKDVTEIRNKLLAISNNEISRIGEFFMTCQFDDELKKLYSIYRDALSADNTLEDYGIILAYKIWRELYQAGIDLDTFMDIIDYPSAKIIKKRLLDFLKDSEMQAEVMQHLKAERPEAYKKYKKQGYVEMLDISQEEAQLLDYPTKLRTTRETEDMVKNAQEIINEYFPIASIESPRQLFFAPIHPFAIRRAYQSRTYNSERNPVNVVVMTPSVDSAEEFLETLAHETTHAVHSIVLKLAAEYNIITRQQADQVPTGVLEDFSQLVEGQFRSRNTEENPKIKHHKGKNFASFNQATSSRWQAPFGLVQLEVRERFETWIKSGVKVLTIDMLSELRYEFNKKMVAWWETGIRFTRPGLSALSWVSALAPDDGLVYMKRYITPPKVVKSVNAAKTGTQLSMSEAFKKRFGDEWIKKQDARILLYWLLVETGRNHNTEQFGSLILTKDIRVCLEELQKISIDASEFKEIDS